MNVTKYIRVGVISNFKSFIDRYSLSAIH